mmetsp:Transcript_96265/g.310611  ORF Transcript_96265/g.310611 Transcript_96265/m.310611 type:complete len:133 (-) Transcript_96265:158-556(-)
MVTRFPVSDVRTRRSVSPLSGFARVHVGPAEAVSIPRRILDRQASPVHGEARHQCRCALEMPSSAEASVKLGTSCGLCEYLEAPKEDCSSNAIIAGCTSEAWDDVRWSECLLGGSKEDGCEICSEHKVQEDS